MIERVDPRLAVLLVEGVRITRLVGEEVFNICSARLSGRTDEVRRPRLPVERLVPNLVDVIGIPPPPIPGYGQSKKNDPRSESGGRRRSIVQRTLRDRG